MSYFFQSLISVPSYIPDDLFKPDFSLLSLQGILNEPISPKDRKDLNKIYEHADLFVKRNSIVMINNKKQKKLLGSATQGVNQSLLSKPSKEDSLQSSFQVIGRQNAFFQEIHPTDVEKNHEDNIFDYRLHLKLARGQQIFKVEEIKRKPKRRNNAGKECECCGKEVMRNHQCKHTFCEQKCGKVIKRTDSKKDGGSSLMSDSKDENWSDQNYDGEKAVRIQPSRRDSDKKSKINRRQSSSSNKEAPNLGEPSEILLASIEKLLEAEHNNFTYKVIEIKEYESEDEDDEKDHFNEKEMNLEDWQNKEIYAEEDMREEQNEELVSAQKLQKNKKIQKVANTFCNEKKNIQKISALHFFQKQHQSPSKQIIQSFESTENPNQLMAHNVILPQNGKFYISEKKYGSKQIQNDEQLIKFDAEKNKNSEQKNSNQLQKEKLLSIQNEQNFVKIKNQQKQIEMGNKSVPQSQRKSGQNRSQSQKHNKTTNTVQNCQKISFQPQLSALNASQNFRIPSSESDSEENREKRIQEQLQVVQISVNNDSQKKSINKLSSSSSQLLDYENNNQTISLKKAEDIQNQDIQSIARLKSQNSLDEQIDDIIDIQPNQFQENLIRPSEKAHLSHKLSNEVIQKLSKKDSKKIKMIEKERLMSQKIEDIDPIEDLEENPNQPSEDSFQEEKTQQDEYKGQGKGRGKGQFMGRGKGIFQQELDNYQEDSQLLESSDQQAQKQQENQQSETRKIANQEKITNPKCQSRVACLASSPIIHQPLTPKRQIPNMETIIKHIQLETENDTYEKGLGRGKIFGRGLGVLEEAEELEKEVEHNGLEIAEIIEGEKWEKAKKKIKTTDPAVEKEKIDWKESAFEEFNEQDDFPDKLQELIEQEEDEKVNLPENLYLNKSCQNDKAEAMYHKRYLEKRQSIGVGLSAKYDLSEEEYDLQKESGEDQDKELDLKEISGKFSNGQEENLQDKKLSQQDEQLESFIDLNGENNSA